MPDRGMSDDESPEKSREEMGWRAHVPVWLRLLSVVSLLGGGAAAVFLAVVYRWPTVNVPVYYFVVRPPFAWFGGLLPFICAGIFGVRLRWLAAALLVWGVCLVGSGEFRQLCKFSPQDARDDFAAARMAYRSYSERNPSRATPEAIPLRIISWNVAGGDSMDKPEWAARWLGRKRPDIVLFQEFKPGMLAEAIKNAPHFQGYQLKGHGLAVLSRFPVEKVPSPTHPPYRVTSWKVHVSADQSFTLINAHLQDQDIRARIVRGLSWERLRETVRKNHKEVTRLHSLVKDKRRQGAVLLAGDFNLPPNYPPMRRLRHVLRDCYAANGYGWGRTAPASYPVTRIDMILAPAGSRVYYCASLPTNLSDHRPVVAGVNVPLK